MSESLRSQLEDGVLRLTFDRVQRLNAFTGRDYRDLRGAVEAAATDPAVRVVVITGAGRAFSAGADRSLLDGSATAEDQRLAGKEFEALLEALSACDKPIIAAVNGLAVGVGCTILLHCDLVLVAGSARLRLPFTALGIVPEAGSSALLVARSRWGPAAWAMLSSEWFDAEQAVAMDLAWRVVADEDLIKEVGTAAATLAGLDPAAVAATKRLLTAGRAEVSRAAVRRELHEMALLLGRGSEPPPL